MVADAPIQTIFYPLIIITKLSKNSALHGLNRAKSFLGNAYNTTMKFLGNLDTGIRLFKVVYGSLSPMIDNYGGAGVTQNVMKTLSGYDNIRHQVMTVDNDIDAVRNNPAKKNIKFNFA